MRAGDLDHVSVVKMLEMRCHLLVSCSRINFGLVFDDDDVVDDDRLDVLVGDLACVNDRVGYFALECMIGDIGG